jgi:hypothetical protein
MVAAGAASTEKGSVPYVRDVAPARAVKDARVAGRVPTPRPSRTRQQRRLRLP